MANNEEKPGALHSFLGGLLLTIVLVIVVPVLTAYFVTPYVERYVTFEIWNFHTEMIVGAVMLLVMILFLLLLGGGKIFKKYGVIGVVGLIIAYWWLGNIWDALLPVIIILVMVGFTYARDSRK